MTESRTEAILRVGQELIQTRGYAGFSYRDVAAAVGIKSASVHYHFPTKADLVARVTADYRESFDGHLARIRASGASSRSQLRAYASLYTATLTGGRLCLCGMLATESELLPKKLRDQVDGFFRDQMSWIEETLHAGILSSEFEAMDVPLRASLLVAALEGTMIIARNRGEGSRDLAYVVDQLMC